ncbi:MAG: hypothetical protein ABIP42_00240 [Planctomycetota bacterium]
MPILFLAALLSSVHAQDSHDPAQVSLLHEEVAAVPSVHWHATYDEALAASRVSCKPVMLFQLLGKLDDALC